MTEVVAVDIGGTHARFAIAEIEDSRVTVLGAAYTLKTAEHADLQSAWRSFESRLGRPLPQAAAIAIAGPVEGEALKLTNNSWVIRPASVPAALGVARYSLINDFGAIAHAVAQLDNANFLHLCGPDRPISQDQVVSVVGPGTGLGIGQLVRFKEGYRVIETEGGHIDFAPLDSFEDRLLTLLRERHRRVSTERIVSGTGLANIYEALAAMEERRIEYRDEKALWTAALAGADSLAAAALERFCLSLGAVAGDIALAQGASALVIAGGLGLRLASYLPGSRFRERFVAKGRFEKRLDEIPVKLIVHPQPGLFGAAAAFAGKFGQ